MYSSKYPLSYSAISKTAPLESRNFFMPLILSVTSAGKLFLSHPQTKSQAFVTVKTNSVLSKCTVVLMFVNNRIPLETVLKLSLEHQDVSWINMSVVHSPFQPLRLQCSMKLIKCLTLVSKKISRRSSVSLERTKQVRLNNHRICYSLPLCLHGYTILLKSIFVKIE